MEIRTVLLIVLAAIAALIIVFYQYFYKNPKKGSLRIYLAFLRFIAFFCGLLLLINPKFVKHDYFLEKANLILLIDDSESMSEPSNGRSVDEIITKIVGDNEIQQKYSINSYAFGTSIQTLDSLKFNQSNTDIYSALSTIDEIYVGSENNAIVLVTDGNQTLGRDYSFVNLGKNMAVNPIVIGDTTSYDDISIHLINTNTYAFLGNKFPIETNIVYTGKESVAKTVTITLDQNLVHRQRLDFDSNNNSQTLHILVEAKSIGYKSINVSVEPLDNERNVINNNKETAIEVIDEKTNVAIVADMLHPDIGALKKSIEANEQRSVEVVKPNELSNPEDFDIFILYQPNRNFKIFYEYLAQSKASSFTIAGTATDWYFLNQAQNSFFKENVNQTEEILPNLNKAFGIYGLGDFETDDFPPLESTLGDIEIKESSETIISQRIRGVDLDAPLFTILTSKQQKGAVLFGENIWKWRAQTYRNNQSFQSFDDFIGKLMVYLTADSKRARLDVDFERVFENAGLAKIRAEYFDESFQFDSDATLTISVQGKNNDFVRESPMLLKGNYHEVDLSDLDAGEYVFTVTVSEKGLQRSGTFKILDFNPEKQLLSSNYNKLKKLADNTTGTVYVPESIDELITYLTTSEQYRPVQKSTENVVSLIDFRLLLGLIALALSLEWFIRKYNGLI
ncbi:MULTISPECIES: vWA domain-containing protein [Flavobacteriaceae]|uniref:vWA domain-containing protein n=1 Tax=Flavobacteriaceae TaxID=49546 RepID=UPI001491B557|nr:MULTISPECIES: vWA domain-containing protein [Allomuricauda]MDC6364613.1 VWA domain-containing protein [Muricauda sp. AC10]